MQTDVSTLIVDGVTVDLCWMRRGGSRPPVLCLHGFGSTKEDYADLALFPGFEDRDLVFWDAPGCGQSTVSDPTVLSIPFLVSVTQAACAHLGIERFHVVGHSMGGLTALLFAAAAPERVLSFFNIEGNIAPEDCFLSRQIVDFPAETPEAFLRDFLARVKDRPEFCVPLYARALPLKVQTTTVAPIFRSMVAISDTQPLMQIYADLPFPKAFVYGAQNRQLSYLGQLPDLGVAVIEIAHSAHFPMYSNPPALWSALAGFIDRAEAAA